MKRVLSLFLSCIFVLGVCFSTPIVASATDGEGETETIKSNEGFLYQIPDSELEPEICQIVGYDVENVALVTSVDIPQYITIGNEDNTTRIQVGSVSTDAFVNCSNLEYVFFTGTAALWVDDTPPENVIVHTNSCSVNQSTPYVESEDGTTIYEKCSCDKYRGEITLVATENATYGDETIAIKVEQTGKLAGVENSVEGGYTLSYTENSYTENETEYNTTLPTDAGSYTAKLEYKGLEVEKAFTILPKTITAKLDVPKNGFVYNGEEYKPTVKFTDIAEPFADVALTMGEENDYTVTYADNVNAGIDTATATVALLNSNYTFVDENNNVATKELVYTIDKAPLTITVENKEIYVNHIPRDFDYESTGLVQGDTINLTLVTDFDIDDPQTGTYPIKLSGEIVVKNGEDKQTTSNYTINFNEGTLTVVECPGHTGGTATCMQKAECDICFAEYGDYGEHNWEFTANGSVITATCLTEDCIDYKDGYGVKINLKEKESLTYTGDFIENPVEFCFEDAGIEDSEKERILALLPEIVYTGNLTEEKIVNTGNYTATVTIDEEQIAILLFTISPKQLTDNEIAITGIENSYVYTGTDILPEISLTDNEKQLVSGTDYTVSYSEDVTNAGTVTVTVTGIGNYTDEKQVTYTIAPKEVTATLTQDSGVYNGSAHQPTVEISGLCVNETLTNGTDYTVEYSDNTNVGTVTVTVRLTETSLAKNYTFANNAKTTTLTYTITAGVATIKTAPTAKTALVYTGSAQALVTAGEATNGTMQYRLSENESWSTTIPSGINAKTYTVYYKVKGDLNYSDSDVASVDVTVAKATPTAENFTLTLPTNLVSNGEEKKVTVNCGADIGDITVEYYSGETKLENAPVTAGTYTVKINVAANDNYNAVDGITSDDWKFTITECTKHEWENSKCTICKIDCEHKYEDGKSAISNKVTTPATCVKEGVLFTQCKICDYELESPLDIDSDAHKMSDWTETVKATCSSTGTEESVCENEGCTHTETRATEKDADNHTYGDWVVTAATCVADGEKVKTCTNAECNHEIKETIAKDPTAHKLATEWEVTKEPTCVETGLQVKTCLNTGCDHAIEEVIAIKADAHNLGGWVVTKAAKCTIAGEITRFCKNENCEYKVTDSLDADGITHDFATEFTTVEATCILAGSKFRACLNEGCKEVTEKTEIAIDPDAHKNVETINVKQPTCEEKGYTGDEHCNDCKKTFEPGIEVDALGHTESEWIVDKEATFTEEGARHISCTVCEKELKKEVIEKRALETPVVKIENAGSGIKVSWSQDEDATGYTVYRSEYNSSTKKWSAWKNRGTAAATKKNWTDKTVKEGVTYRFTVRSVNGDRKSSYKATSGILYVVAPKVTVSITSTGLLAKWNKVNNATSYIVYRAELDADGNWGKWVQLGTTKAEKNTWSDTKVKSGVTYKYTVRAVAGKVKSGYTGSSAIIYLEQPLLKISNSANGITGKWEQVAGATGYTIYRSEYNPSIKKWTKWLNLGTTKATAKSFTDKTAKSGYQYKYTIRAINGKLKSTYQDSNKLICLAQPTLKISNVANGIQGKWNQVNGATGYIIYRSELKDGKWTKWVSLGTAKATAKSFTDKTVKSGVEYKYTVRAKNGSYKSSYIDSNTSIFLSVPAVKIANAGAGVKVSWGKIEGAKNYLVYRSEYNSSTKKWSGWKILETVDTTSFVDETAVSNVKYKYTVRALNGDYRSYYKASAELLYLKTPTVTAEKIDEGMKVSWTKIDGAKSYVIYRSELGEDGKWSKWVKLGTAGEKYTSCKDKTVKENVTYKYTVRAVNGKIMSSYVASEQILNGVVTETTPEEPKTDVVA